MHNMNSPSQLESAQNTALEPYSPPKNLLLDAYAIALAEHTANGYPQQQQRLFLHNIPYSSRGLIALPNSGPWTAGKTFPNRYEQLNEVLHNIGYPKMCELDAEYRPLHPWWKDMVRRADIGGVVGRGFFYHWGANYTADAAVTMTDANNVQHLLLIQREDTGEWALPGGFLESAEPTKFAAVRELQEEAGLLLDRSNATAKKLYAGPVLDVRTTLHAWTETSLWLFETTFQSKPVLLPSDDAKNAEWFPINELPIELYGSHPILIQMALNRI